MKTAVSRIEELAEVELAAVSFVRDYVELHFDGPVLRCYANPEVVRAGGGRARFPEAGSRDALCELIGATVASVELTETAIRLDFGGGTAVRVEFQAEWDKGQEAAEFIPTADGRPQLADRYIW